MCEVNVDMTDCEGTSQSLVVVSSEQDRICVGVRAENLVT